MSLIYKKCMKYLMEYGDLLEQIFKISPSIRFAGMYDADSEKITDDFQPGVLQHLSRDEMKDCNRYDGKRWDTYKLFQSQLGEPNFSMVKYDKVIQTTFALYGGKRLRVSMEPDSDYKSLIDRIQNMLMRIPVLGASLLAMEPVFDTMTTLPV